MEQIKITSPTKLLDESGNVLKPGYCEHNRYIYNRSDIKASSSRIKEWDFYQITDKRYTVQFTVADISLGGACCFTLIDRETGERTESMGLSLFTNGKIGLEADTNKPHFLIYKKGGFYGSVQVTPNERFITCSFQKGTDSFEAEFTMSVMKGLESLVMAVPFKKDKHFYLNQKMNSMPTDGFVKKNGEIIMEFKKDSAFCVLDWGRGVWPYAGSWYWGNGNTYLPDGHIFGFEIGWGFGDMSAATENMIFYDGVGHKLEEVYLKKDENDYMKPWMFTSSDGRFEFTMTPEFDNYTSSRVLGVAGNKCHQVFGKWNGTAVLDDGTKITVEDMTAFTEFSDNRW